MRLEILKNYKAVLIFSAAYMLAFTAYFLSIKGYEFLWYIGVMVVLFGLILSTLHRSRFDRITIWGLSIWGLLHMAGGGIKVGGAVLYAKVLIPLVSNGELTLLKYDQAVHAFGFAVATLVAYHLLKPYLLGETNWKVVYPLVVLMGMGLGVVNEIVEFIAVLTFPETGVGGYYNTSLDLVFNTIGAVLAAYFIRAYYKPTLTPSQNRQ